MKLFHHITVFIFIAVCVPMTALSQTPSILTSVDKNSILIGQQIEMTVQVKMPDNQYRLTWLDTAPEFGSFVLASKDKIDSTYSNGLLGFSQKLHITSFDSGSQVIPQLTFQFETLSGDSSFRMFTDSIPVEVMYSPADSVLPFHDIRTIIPVKKEKAWWFWPLIIAASILLIIIIMLIIRKKRKKKSEDLFESKLSDYDEAIQFLHDLKGEHFPDKGEFKLYFVRLTDIFKRYLSRKTNDNKMHLTGAEMITELSHYEISRERLDAYASCSRMADAVKFAKYKPSVKDSEQCLDEISRMIDLLHAQKKEAENDL